MATLEERLEEWIFNRCQGTIPQPRRVAEMNTILRDIYNDRRFLRYRNSGNPDDYEDALCLMWKHFEKNLCKTITANKSYLETRTYAVNRLLASLIGNLKNIRKKRYKEEADKEPHRMGSDGVFIDPLDELPSPEPDPEPDPEPEYDPEVVWKIFLELLAKDPKGDLKAEANTLHGIKKSTKETTQENYTLTAQDYLLMKYRDKKTDQQIANELDIPRQSLQRHVGKPKKWEVLARDLAQMATNSVLGEGGYYDV